jgi:hypothetical protein
MLKFIISSISLLFWCGGLFGQPTIASFDPTSGHIGTSVTITGTGFDSAPANNIVFFGATKAVVTAASTTELTITVPLGATYEPISVNTNGLIAHSQVPFIVTFDDAGIYVNSFELVAEYPLPPDQTENVAIGDFDGDGKLDIMGANEGGSMWIYRNLGNGTIDFGEKVGIFFSGGYSTGDIVVEDFDGDGKLDLARLSYGGRHVAIFRNTSSGVGDINFDSPIYFDEVSYPFHMEAGDFDGDGRVDLIVANDGLVVFRNTGTPGNINFASGTYITTGRTENTTYLKVGDLDNDGMVDLVEFYAWEGGTTMTISRNSSSGELGEINFEMVGELSIGEYSNSMAIGDLNNDGKNDIVVVSPGSIASVFRNTSQGFENLSFEDKVDFHIGYSAGRVMISDMDGDSKPDIVAVNTGAGTASILKNTTESVGAITFKGPAAYPAGSGPYSLAIGDLDNDNKPEMIVGNIYKNTISILRNAESSPSTETEMTAFSFAGFGEASVNATEGTIAIEIPYGSDITSLVAQFTVLDYATAFVNSNMQISGTTVNDFSNPVVYSVVAEDGVTVQDWVVTVSVTPPRTATEIIEFSLIDFGGASVNSTDHTVAIEVPYGSDIMALVAEFTLSDSASVYVNSNIQISGTTFNDFSNPVIYSVVAEDGVTMQNWVITVSVTPPRTATEIIEFSLINFGEASVNSTDHTVAIEVPYGLDITDLIVEFTLSDSASVYVDSEIQISGTTFNDFSNPVIYSVVAEDGVTIQDWVVTVGFAPPSTATEILTFGFVGFGDASVNSTDHTISFEASYGSDITDLAADFTLLDSALAYLNSELQVSGTTVNDFTNPATYSIIAQDGVTMQDWVVTVTIGPPPPIIHSYSPTTGPVGTTVTILGVEFDAIAEDNIVYFGATRAVVNAASETELIVTVPAGVTYEPITVTTNGLVGNSQIPFVLTFNGTGISTETFAQKEDLGTGASTRAVAIGDLDGDGKPDLAVVSRYPYVSIHLNTSISGGSITYASRIELETGDRSESVKIADIDGDGKLDVIVNTQSNHQLLIYKNTSAHAGEISFEEVKIFESINSGSLSIRDLNMDGMVDIVVGGTSQIATFRNVSSGNGNISFIQQSFNTGRDHNLTVGDLNGDDRPDLAVVDYWNKNIFTYRNTSLTAGAISFEFEKEFATGIRPTFIAMGDLNSDGKLDMAVTNSHSHTVSVYQNISSGAGDINFSTESDFITGETPQAVVISDINGDGMVDLVVSNYSSNMMSVFENTSNNDGLIYFKNKIDFPSGLHPFGIAIGDLNADGKNDMVASILESAPKTVSIFRNEISVSDVLNYGFDEQTSSAIIHPLDHTIQVEVEYGTDINNLIPTFEISKGAVATVNNVVQVSGITPNDFSSPVIYSVIAEDGIVSQDWVVTVNISPNTETEITSFSLAGFEAIATINATDHTVITEVPYGTDVTALVSDFSLSDNAVAYANTTVQTSGATINDFTNPITYTIMAEDGVTEQDWVVTVNISPNTETEITSFNLTGFEAIATINSIDHTITTEVPYGSDVTALVSEFSLSDNAVAYANTTVQTSGATINDFTNPVTYTIIAEDGIIKQDWVITVEASTIAGTNDKQSGIVIYPNPFEDKIDISISDNPMNHMVRLMSIDGKIIKTVNIEKNNTVLNLSDLKGGVYLMQIYSKNVLKETQLLVKE